MIGRLLGETSTTHVGSENFVSLYNYMLCYFRTVRLAHAVYGSPTQRVLPIVILHGVLGHKLNWRSAATNLAKESGRQVWDVC